MLEQTALGGRLIRRPEGWFVRFGRREVPAPWVRDLRLRDLAPNWRVITPMGRLVAASFVEVPRWWRDVVRDPDVRAAIEGLVDGLEEEAIYAEGVAEATGDHRRTYRGYLVPLAAWDERMAEVVGATWDERVVGRRELAELLGVSPKTVDAWRRRPDFPSPVRVEGSGRADGRGGRRTPRWRLTDVLTWLARA